MKLFILLFNLALIILSVFGIKLLVEGIRRKDKKKIREAILFLFFPLVAFGFLLIPFVIVLVTGDLM